MISLGIDVGGSTVKVAAIRGSEVLWTAQSERHDRPTREELTTAIRTALAGRFVPGSTVGICVPGVRDRAGRMVTKSVNIPTLEGLVLDDLVADCVQAPMAGVEITSDQVAAAYDLYVAHQLKGRLLSIALGTGVGAAVLDDGVPLMVDGESPGHIGQMDVSIEGAPVIGPDNGAGSLEGYLGAPALTAQYGSDMADTLRRLGADDPPIKALARAIRICHAIYCPDHVALMGGLGIRLGHLLPVIRKLVETNLTNIARPNWTLLIGEDDYHAARGAARMALARAKATT